MNSPEATQPKPEQPAPALQASQQDARPLRICYFGAYRAEYSRNRIMIAGLRRQGLEVIECHAQLWQEVDDREEAVRGLWRRPAFWGRLLRTYWRLLRGYARLSRADYDLMVVGYPGQFDVFLARILSRLHGKPLVWDVFMSIYLIAIERGLDGQHGFMVRLLRRIERWACRLPDCLILDTSAYVAWFAETHGVDPARFRLVPTGADSDQFRAVETPPRAAFTAAAPMRIIYYGTFIPNHGVPTMVAAAAQLQEDPEIRFEFIGQGPELAKVQAQARELGLGNVVFTPWLAPAELAQRVAQADLLLGVFGATPQSMMTVQNKIYEALALAKPIVTGDSPTVRAALMHGEHLYLCARADPAALAQAIRTLKADPALRARLGRQGHATFAAHYSLPAIGATFAAHLRAEHQRSASASKQQPIRQP